MATNDQAIVNRPQSFSSTVWKYYGFLANYKVGETMPFNSNPLLWQKANELKYPTFSKLAKIYFFSAGNLVSAQRSCLQIVHVDKLIF